MSVYILTTNWKQSCYGRFKAVLSVSLNSFNNRSILLQSCNITIFCNSIVKVWSVFICWGLYLVKVWFQCEFYRCVMKLKAIYFSYELSYFSVAVLFALHFATCL
jgi:hypothetical protein